MKLKKNEKRKSESGAIMLEVVAVLSLMGLMGTVLYRQIYQRNQELHNIQMASEIRIVKEAFSAWIHANTAPLYDMCRMSEPAIKADPGLVNTCDSVPLKEIEIYLPDGYFFGGGAGAASLGDNYDFHLFGYWRGTGGAAIPTYYGVVVPKADTMLPDGGGNEDTWNFRRAARVAMLVGIDGGAYDKTITDGEIVGSVGTWSLDADGILFESDDELSAKIPTYVAMTGLDVFQPEVELPSIEVGFNEEDWSMAFQGLNAYGLFTVGQDANCYEKRRTAIPEGEGVFALQSDIIKAPGPDESCKPAFWVTTGKDDADKEIGHVYVLNDLHVGAVPSAEDPEGTSAIQLKKEGAIVFRNTAQDLQNQNQETNYLLDPAYTSVMNDVKLMSRGGAKLSEILPNYILKDVQRGTGSVQVKLSVNYCPKGYVVGIRANPISWSDDNKLSATDIGTIIDGSTDEVETSTDKHDHKLISGRVTLPETLAKAKERVVSIVRGGTCTPAANTSVDTIYRGVIERTACVGWKDKGSAAGFEVDGGAVLEVSVYCIWPGDLDLNGDGETDIPKNGEYIFAKPDSGRTDLEETYCNSFKAPGTCTLMGCTWHEDSTSDKCKK